MSRKRKGSKHSSPWGKSPRAANALSAGNSGAIRDGLRRDYVTLPNGEIGKKIGLDEKVDLRQGGKFVVAKKNDDGSLTFPAGSMLDDVMSKVEQMTTGDTMLGNNVVPRNWNDHASIKTPTRYDRSKSSTTLDVATEAEIERLLRQKKLIQPHHFSALLRRSLDVNSPLNEKTEDGLLYLRTIADLGEWFAFSDLQNDFIKSEILRVQDALASGLVHLPYPMCVFTHGFLDEDGIFSQCVYMMVEGSDDLGPNGLREGYIAIIEIRISLMPGRIRFEPRLGVATNFKPSPLDPTKRYSELIANPLNLNTEQITAEASSVIDPVGVMMMAVNTKNLRMERVEPAAALNKARARQGKPPLRRITRVYMHEYVAAAKVTDSKAGKGTHASPRPHLRRAHLRYRDHPTVKPRWIEACIVNAHKGPVVQRDGYMVSE